MASSKSVPAAVEMPGSSPSEMLATTTLSRRPNLLIFHGEKGGVGKSSAAKVTASAALKAGLRVHVLETDKGVPDVGPVFLGRPGATVSALPLIDGDVETGEILNNLLVEVERLVSLPDRPDLIVINTPAGSSDVLDGQAESFASVTETLDIDLTIGWLLDTSVEVLPKIVTSIQSGMLSIPGARRALIYTGWHGDTEKFPISTSPERAAAIAAGVEEKHYPSLTPAMLWPKFKAENRPVHELLDPAAGLPVISRSQFSTWLQKTKPMTNWLIGLD